MTTFNKFIHNLPFRTLRCGIHNFWVTDWYGQKPRYPRSAYHPVLSFSDLAIWSSIFQRLRLLPSLKTHALVRLSKDAVQRRALSDPATLRHELMTKQSPVEGDEENSERIEDDRVNCEDDERRGHPVPGGGRVQSGAEHDVAQSEDDHEQEHEHQQDHGEDGTRQTAALRRTGTFQQLGQGEEVEGRRDWWSSRGGWRR